MAQDIVAHIDDRDEIRELLRQLAQELALCDALKFKNKTLLANVPLHNDAKAKSLAEEYRAAIAVINDGAAENMNREIQAMDRFSEEVRQFNDLSADYVLAIAMLRRLAEEGK